MADNNSKKPMALLLLVVVGVLVVLALSEDQTKKISSCVKEIPAYCSDISFTTKEDCNSSEQGVWYEESNESLDFIDEISCKEAGGIWKLETHDANH